MGDLTRHLQGVCICLLWALAGALNGAAAAEVRIEAESAGQQPGEPSPAWKIEAVQEASEGAVAAGEASLGLAESKGLAVELARAGRYWVWVRYQCGGEGECSNFYVLVRDDVGEGIALGKMDFVPRLATQRPYEKARLAVREGTKAGDFVWEKLPVVAERPMRASISFGNLVGGGKLVPRRIDCVIVSDQETFRPDEGGQWRKIAPAEEGAADVKMQAPAGMQAAEGFPMHSSFFAGIAAAEKQFTMGISYNAAVYRDDARVLQLGFNRQHGSDGGSVEHGIWTMAGLNVFDGLDAEEGAKYPSPEGRFVNAQGEVGERWSLSFEPLRQSLRERTRARFEQLNANPAIDVWRLADESGGVLDYSEPAQKAFGRWLAKHYASIAELNRRWGTSYESFDRVVPPKSAAENKAGWFAFREFSGEVFAQAVADQAEAIRAVDGKGRRLLGQSSNADLLAPRFMAMRPMDWEQLIDVGLSKEKYVGWDGYCADDYMGCEVDLLDSLAGGRTLINQEWNVHAADWRLASRTMWTMIDKGVQGVHCYQLQEGTFDDSYPKWALWNHDFTPKEKLGAMSDAAQEVHRLEPMVMSARRKWTTKPVALYYSRLDLSLGAPLMSAWGEAVDTPYHVYSTLRGMGYAVRWITPKQIEAGQLADVGAVVLVNAKYIPAKAARMLAQWVEGGGAVIADQWPGAFDEYGRPQSALAEVFGVRAIVQKAGGSALALQQSNQGYGEVSINAIQGDQLPDTVGEIWQQWDSTHPMAQMLGSYTLAGYGLTKVRCTAGQVVGMTFGGLPGVVVNPYGKGQAMYVSLMLGSIYEGAATRYEADTTHSGMAYHRLLDAFLRFAGAEPAARVELPLRLRAKIRVEAPLVDSKGNALVGVVSMNDRPFDEPVAMTLAWGSLSAPRQVLAAVAGSRKLAPVSFEMEQGKLKLTLPPFDTHATVLALVDAQPLVGLDISGAKRGAAGLLLIHPAEAVTLKATVYNPSPARVSAGRVALWAPRGWFLDQSEQAYNAIEPWGSAAVTFRVQSPSMGGPTRLRPLVVKQIAGQTTSTPATEMVWWNPPMRRSVMTMN